MITPTPYEVRTLREPCRSVPKIDPSAYQSAKEASIVACRGKKRQAPETRRKPTGANRSAQDRTGALREANQGNPRSAPARRGEATAI